MLRGVYVLLIIWLSAMLVPSASPQPLADYIVCTGICSGARGVAVDPTNGDLYVADSGNNRVLRFLGPVETSNPTPIGVLGQADFSHTSPNNEETLPAANTMSDPQGVFVDSAGTLWVSDTGNSRVLWFLHVALKTNGSNADGVFGQPNFSTGIVTGVSAALMHNPTGLFVDRLGSLWVADANNNRVLRFTNATSKLATGGAQADGVLGQPGFGDSLSHVDRLSSPCGITGNRNNDIFVADASNNRVLYYPASEAYTLNGMPSFTFMQRNLTLNGIPEIPTETSGDQPRALVLDLDGNLYVADSGNARVLIYKDGKNPSHNGDPASDVLGQGNFNTEGTGTAPNQMQNPTGLAYDRKTATLWVADSTRILGFTDFGELSSDEDYDLDIEMSFDASGPFARLFPKDSFGNTSSAMVLYVSPVRIDEINANRELVVSAPFPLHDYEIDAYTDERRTQYFDYETVVLDADFTLEYALYLNESAITHAGITFTALASSVKLTIEITDWNFHNVHNTLAIYLNLNTTPAITGVTNLGSVDDITTFLLDSGGVMTTTLRVLNKAVADEEDVNITASIEGVSTLVLEFPYFQDKLEYDPNISVLLNGENSASGDGGDDSNLALLALLALLIIPMSVIVVIVVAIAYWFAKKQIKIRNRTNTRDAVNFGEVEEL